VGKREGREVERGKDINGVEWGVGERTVEREREEEREG